MRCRQMNITCLGNVWTEQDVTHAELSVLVCSPCEGSATALLLVVAATS